MGDIDYKIALALIVGTATYLLTTWLGGTSEDYRRGLAIGSAIGTYVWAEKGVPRG